MSAIILNRMYAGGYLESGENIGHEIINLYKADNGCNYVYINAYGWIAKKWDKKISEILLVRMVNKCTLEILGVASELQQIICKYDYKKEDAYLKEQTRYVRENGIKYGSVFLDEIMKENQDEVKYKPQLVTFRAECVKRPTLTIYLTTDKSLNTKSSNSQYFYLPEYTFSCTSPKFFCDEHEQSKAHAVLKKVIDDSSLWLKPEDSTGKVNLKTDKQSEKFSFLTLIKKEYDELSYSNMLEYFFNLDKNVFFDFCQKVLGVSGLNEDYEIVREIECNIDLLIKTKKHVIVIENKIKSGINGLGHDIKTEEDAKNQLKKYYNYVRKTYSKCEQHFFLLTPNYNIIDPLKYVQNGEYKSLLYSDVYDFFSKVKSDVLKKNKYFDDFLIALKKQSELIDNQNFDIMQNRFVKRIAKIKNKEKKRKEVCVIDLDAPVEILYGCPPPLDDD